jgi:hypothetical protein
MLVAVVVEAVATPASTSHTTHTTTAKPRHCWATPSALATADVTATVAPWGQVEVAEADIVQVVSLSKKWVEAAMLKDIQEPILPLPPILPLRPIQQCNGVCYRLCNCGLGVCATSLMLPQAATRSRASEWQAMVLHDMKRVLGDSTIVNGAIPDVVMQAAATAARDQKIDKLKVLLQTGTTRMKDGSVLNLQERGVTKRVAIEDIVEPLSNLRIGFSLCSCAIAPYGIHEC